MTIRRPSSLLTAASLMVAAALLFVGCDSAGTSGDMGPSDPVSPGEADPGTWTLVRSATDNTIYDVAMTTDGAYAVAEGGLLLRRQQDTWEVVINDGPSSNGSDLFGLAVTGDGSTLWFVGASGAVGEYDVTTGSLTDHSGFMDVTNNFRDVAVTGDPGSANVYVSGASGKAYYSFGDGDSGTWNSVTPGNGSELRAIDFFGPRSGALVDANQTVFNTSDGSTWSRIGIADANVSFYGVDADASDDAWVVGGGGTVYQWNGSQWSPNSIGEPTLRDIEVSGADDSGLAVGGSGAVFSHDGTEWTREDTPTGQNLQAVVRGDLSIAVGADGTVLEK